VDNFVRTSECLDWQEAIDLASSTGKNRVIASGVHLATASLKMRPNVSLEGENGATLRMADGAELLTLLDFITYSASGASVSNITVDGNREHNTDDLLSKHMVIIHDANDVTIRDCKIINSSGNGIYVRNGFRTVIDRNHFTNMYVAPVIVYSSIKSNYRCSITNNTIDGEWGQHAIIVKWSNFAKVQGNYIVGQCVRGFSVNMAYGSNVYSQSGNYFYPNCKGKFVIFNAGVEGLIMVYADPTLVSTNLNLPNPGIVPASWGNGDVISIQGSDDCDVSENLVYGGASLGISVFSDGAQWARRNKIYKNHVHDQGSAGISIQNVANTFVVSTLIEGNTVVNCGLNGGASAAQYNVGIAVRGGANTQRVSVVNNIIDGTIASMDYGIAFDAAVYGKMCANNIINGTIGGKTIQNP